MKIALNHVLTLPDDGKCPALLISCGIIALGAFCVELWPNAAKGDACSPYAFFKAVAVRTRCVPWRPSHDIAARSKKCLLYKCRGLDFRVIRKLSPTCEDSFCVHSSTLRLNAFIVLACMFFVICASRI